MKVYQAIANVMGDLAKSGISKDQTNTFDKYKFRGIDDVYNALAPLLAKHGLLVLPRVLERHSVERESQKGGALFYVTVKVEFDFVAAEDGSKHTICAYGEAMDRGDKGTNKAMTAAYKYACFEAFCIPTEGSDDADAETHAVVSTINASPHDGVWEALDADQQIGVRKVGVIALEFAETGDIPGMYAYIQKQGLDTDEKSALNTMFDPPTRSALKREHTSRQPQKEKAA